MSFGSALFWLGTGYLWCGLAAALAFLLFALDRIDPSAHGAYAFRPLLVPGLVVLWPLVIVTWWRRSGVTKES